MKNKYGKDIETFAQKVAQEEDAGTKAINDKYGVPTEDDLIKHKELSTSEVLRQGFDEEQAQRKKEEEDEEEEKQFLDDVANNTPNMTMFDHLEEEPKDEVININNYERYWDNSTPNGHQIRILKKDNSTLTINMEWPKDENPRLRKDVYDWAKKIK
jgi:hypothetical protein